MESIIKAIDVEIAKLQEVRGVISGLQNGEHKPGKPSAPNLHLVPTKKRHHNMTPEGRARISRAAKLRWKKKRAEARHAAKAA